MTIANSAPASPDHRNDSAARLFAEIGRHERKRVSEVWFFTICLCGVLAVLGWLLTRLPGIFVPFAAIGISGAGLGTLMAISRARAARAQLREFLREHGLRQSLDEVDQEIAKNTLRWPEGSAIHVLVQPVLGSPKRRRHGP